MAASTATSRPRSSALHYTIERVLGWNDAFAARPTLSIGLVFVVAFILAVAGAAGAGFPQPRIHDEHSYLLGAETFAAGRLTNPPHPLAEHFQTFHVLSHPTYASKYPPGQALVLAAGIKLTGKPIVGVWLSFALMCAGVYWMARAWLGPSWALVAALALALRLATSYWVYEYWGGAVAALGGALLLGGARRVVGKSRARDATIMTIGAAILANSRPYEGLLLCIPVTVFVLASLLRDKASVRHRLKVVMLPVAAVLAVTAVLMLSYNHAVTGRATRFPYVAYLEEYGRGPDFVWQRPRDVPPPATLLVQRYQQWELATADSLRSTVGFTSRNVTRLRTTLSFFLPVFLLAPLVALPFALRDPWIRLALVCLATVGVGLSLSSWYQTHYAAPVTALFFVVYFSSVAVWRELRVGRFDAGFYVVALVLAGWGASQLFKLALPLLGARAPDATPERPDWSERRAALVRTLESQEGKDLVIVRYSPTHDFHDEWVYNAADIDGAEIVWAHDLGDRKNARLIQCFRNRKVWVLDVNDPIGYETLRWKLGSDTNFIIRLHGRATE